MNLRLALLLPCLFPLFAHAEQTAVLFSNVRIFNGVDEQLSPGHVLVEKGKIKTISSTPISAPTGATVIDGQGRILSPGFIDLHAHLTMQVSRDHRHFHPWVIGAITAKAADYYLMCGFTTVRDAGGTHPDVARAIELGLMAGPRVYPSGAIISQTAGHGDSRRPEARHPKLDGCCGGMLLGHGHSILADGVPQTLAATRENLKQGATQIKIMGGGGVMSDYDPIHTLQPSPEEIRASVQAAGDWGTYVLAHAYTSDAVQRLVKNGVKVIEHGLLIDEETAKLCAQKGIVISTQVKIFRIAGQLPGLEERNREKLRQVLAGQDRLMAYIKKYKIKTGFGTDFIGGLYVRLCEEFTARAEYFTPAEILRQATSESAEVVRMCGKLNRHGNFGEIREGWVADLLLIEGDPFKDISILLKPEKTLAVIMKEGRVVKRK